MEALPFADDSFDLTMGILTLHHWQDWRQGLREAMRVSGGEVLLLTWFGFRENFWLSDYFPGAADYDNSRFPDKESYEDVLGEIEVHTVPIPHDCRDGFMCAYWRRPEAYLDPAVRAGISTFPKLENVEVGVKKLQHDLDSGRWQGKYGALLEEDAYDFGYRVVRTKSR